MLGEEPQMLRNAGVVVVGCCHALQTSARTRISPSARASKKEFGSRKLVRLVVMSDVYHRDDYCHTGHGAIHYFLEHLVV